MDTIIPPTACMDSFVHSANPLYARVAHNLVQSRTLADIRDALLPKLISGELRLKECEKALS
jgi:type I restriction enzyme S subunit